MNTEREFEDMGYTEIADLMEHGGTTIDTVAQMYARAIALLRQAAMRQAVPEGYVVVPKDPDDWMKTQGKMALFNGWAAEDIYKTMLNAAKVKSK